MGDREPARQDPPPDRQAASSGPDLGHDRRRPGGELQYGPPMGFGLSHGASERGRPFPSPAAASRPRRRPATWPAPGSGPRPRRPQGHGPAAGLPSGQSFLVRGCIGVCPRARARASGRQTFLVRGRQGRNAGCDWIGIGEGLPFSRPASPLEGSPPRTGAVARRSAAREASARERSGQARQHGDHQTYPRWKRFQSRGCGLGACVGVSHDADLVVRVGPS
jgi:hypothetical protein